MMAGETAAGLRSWRLGPPTAEDWPALRSLLADADLPAEGVGPGNGRFLVAADAGGRVWGGVGLEGRAPDVLLRSLVVNPAVRGSGLGGKLLEAAEGMAESAGVQRLYLLTTTAADFFETRGYRRIARGEAPAAVLATDEFARLCPESAVAMVRRLGVTGAG
jgi:amino-acid N-acetyltransferase